MEWIEGLFGQARNDVPILHAAALLDIPLKRKSSITWRAECPKCGGGHRTLAVTPSKRVWYCHKAKKGGDVTQLVVHLTRMGRYDAARWLLSI